MATLSEKLAKLGKDVSRAQAAYDMAVRNQESSTIVNRAKAALNDARKSYELSAPQRADIATARAKTDPGYIAAKANQTSAAAEVTATKKSITDAKAALDTTKATNDANKLVTKATAAAKAEQDAKNATSTALLADQKKKTAETAAALAKAQEELRIAQEGKAAADLAAAESAAAAATTAAELTAAQNAIAAANAAAESATAASAKAVATAEANINQSGDVALPAMSIADTASEMYKKELELKEKNDTALAKRKSITDALIERFESYNLGALATTIRDLVINDANEATITLALKETDVYKERFKANKVRLEKGLRVLQPDEYLSSERTYKQTLGLYGLQGFDKYVNQFLENDTSATEINSRIVTAATRIQNTDPTIIKTLRDFYGLTDTDLVGYVLDTKNQLPEILKKVSAAEVGNAAIKQGLTSNATNAGLLVDQGVDRAQAEATYSKIAEFLPTAEKLSDVYGSTMEGYDQTKAEKEYFGQMASAKRAREALRAREIGTFSGSSGLTKGSLGSPKGQY